MTKFSNIHVSFCAVMAIGLAAPQLASAQSAPSLSGLFACEGIAGAEAQLSCFQIETAKLRGGDAPFASAPSPSVPNIGPATVETESLAAQRERLALETTRLAAEKERFEAEKKRVAALEKDVKMKTKPPKERTLAIQSTMVIPGSGYVRFTLENGEVWEQRESGRVRLGRAEPDMLTIKRASFGSFLGRVNGKSPSIRVKRVR